MRTLIAWLLFGLFALNAITAILRVGKPREAATPADVAILVVLAGLLAWASLYLGGVVR